nr:MAG TPA: hypothetical protein [Caudoviricetes sp.]
MCPELYPLHMIRWSGAHQSPRSGEWFRSAHWMAGDAR